MSPARVKFAHQARSFRPLTIHTSGRSVEVRHPQFMMFLKGNRTILVKDHAGRAHWINTFLISEIEFEVDSE